MISQNIINQIIEAAAVTIEDEETEKKALLSLGNFDIATKLATSIKGSPAYQMYRTMAASAFEGRNDIFHQAYEKYKERINEIYKLSLVDFDLAKKYFIDFYSKPEKRKRPRPFRNNRNLTTTLTYTGYAICNHTVNGISVVNGYGTCPICGKYVTKITKD